MDKEEIIIIADYTQPTSLTLNELCEICGIGPDFILHLVEYEIIHPEGNVPKEWVFGLPELQRVKKVLRLQRDLEVNLAGAAIVLDLLDQLENLNSEIEIIEKHFIPLQKHIR